MENHLDGKPHKNRFQASDKVIEKGGAILLATIGFIGCLMYSFVWNLAHS